MFKTSPEINRETEILTEHLKSLSIGEIVRYTRLTELIDRDVQGPAWYSLCKARKQAEADTSSLFEPVVRVGIKRLPVEELPSVGLKATGRIRRIARNAYRRIAAVKTNDMPPEIALAIDAQRSQLGAIAAVSTRSTQKQISEEVGRANGELPPATTLKLFLK